MLGTSCDPGQAVAVLLVRQYICTWLFADVALAPQALPYREAPSEQASFILDRNCFKTLHVSLQLLFCFPLFSCQGSLVVSLAHFVVAF